MWKLVESGRLAVARHSAATPDKLQARIQQAITAKIVFEKSCSLVVVMSLVERWKVAHMPR
jgi:hypothetical protein